MKKQLQKKLSAFIVPIAIGMMFSASANAQIVYTDVIPDDTISQGTYNLDLNNDGTNDFVITHSVTTFICAGQPRPNRYIRVTPLGTNQVACYSGTNATKMTLNANIDASVLTWNNSVNQLMASRTYHPLGCTPSVQGGQWINAVNGYLGLKLISSGNTYYGWARLNTLDANSFTIKDYAYNTIPNQHILAGQTTVTGIIENSFASSINLFPNPADNQLTISPDVSGGKLKIENVTIYDLTGREVYTENHRTPNSNPEIIIDVSKFPKGIYVVRIQAGDFIATKKLIIKK